MCILIINPERFPMKYESNIMGIKGLTKVYTDGVGVRALDGVDLAIKRESFFQYA